MDRRELFYTERKREPKYARRKGAGGPNKGDGSLAGCVDPNLRGLASLPKNMQWTSDQKKNKDPGDEGEE